MTRSEPHFRKIGQQEVRRYIGLRLYRTAGLLDRTARRVMDTAWALREYADRHYFPKEDA